MSCMPNTIKDFYEWVKSRDPNETYDYGCYHTCARALYSRDRGIPYGHDQVLDKGDIEIAAQQENSFDNTLTMGGLRREIEEHWL